MSAPILLGHLQVWQNLSQQNIAADLKVRGHPVFACLPHLSSLSLSPRVVCDGCAAADAEKIGIPASPAMANRETEKVVG